MTTLQQRLETAMDLGGKTRQDLVRVTKASRQAVNKWFETDAKNLKMEHLFAVADECRVDVRWLATGEGKPVGGAGAVREKRAGYNINEEFEAKHIDLLRMFKKLPKDLRFQIRSMIQTMAAAQREDYHSWIKEQKADLAKEAKAEA
jgi:hypothetical protein